MCTFNHYKAKTMQLRELYSCLLFLFSLFMLYSHAFSQDKEKLREKRQNKLEEIEYTNKLIQKTKKNKKVAVNELMILDKRLQIRKELIAEINDEIQSLKNQIKNLHLTIQKKEKEIQRIKEDYSKMIYNTYKHHNSYNRLMFILSAEDFNQAYKRLKYIKQYADYRKKQVKKLKQLKAELEEKLKLRKQKKQTKIQLLSEKRKEKRKFKNAKQDRKQYIEQLETRKEELEEKLSKKRAIAEKLENEIQKIIERQRKKDVDYTKLTPEEKVISENFEKNKGRLPWPTKRGILTEKFGEHPHPVLDGVTVNNNGVDISTIGGSVVRAMFDGKVTKIFAIKGANNTVIIRHGNFLTVYQNLVDVQVSSGEKVSIKEEIGKVYKNSGQKSSSLHIEIWKEKEKLNPEKWLASE